MTERLLSAPAPVFRVADQVRGELARDLLHVAVEETTAGLRTLAACFLAKGPHKGAASEQLLYLDGDIVDFGKALEMSIGPAESTRTVFRGTVSAIEVGFREGREPEVTVFAEDRLMALRMTHRAKAYEQVSDADIASAIAEAHGLKADATADGPTYDVVQQWNASDLAFLRERAARIQAELWFADDTLHFKTRGQRSAPAVTLVQGNHLLEVQIRADVAHQRTSVRVSGYDAQERDVIDEEAGSDVIDAEVSGGRTGPKVLEQALGARPSFRVRDVALTGPEARAWARAEMLRRCRGFVTATGVTRGTPELDVGSPLTLERVGQPFAGDGYYTTRVRHTYDLHDGFRTRFEAERRVINEAAR
jgi:phage protein D